MGKKTVLVKIGGKVASDENLLLNFIEEIKELKSLYNFIIVHGGGQEVSEISEKLLGQKPIFINGIRQTTACEMEIVEMVLSGLVNKRLIRFFQKNGINAVGLSGGDGLIFLSESIDPQTDQRTGKIIKVDIKLLKLLLAKNYLPILSSTSLDKDGRGININADEAALGLALALKVFSLIFLSDIPGVLKASRLIPILTPATAKKEIEEGVITGGMIPKVESACQALALGVHQVIIGTYQERGSLQKLLARQLGTSICKTV